MVRFQSSRTPGAVESSEGDMKHLLLIVSVLIRASVSVADICSHLPGYSKYGTSCFKLYTSPKTWADAEASCVADGGHLASIHSSEEQAFIANLISARTDSKNTWIGVSGVPPNMTWSDNTNMDYTAWSGTNPDESGHSCGRMRSTNSYIWGDRTCEVTTPYICRAETQAYFTKIPGGVPMDAAAVPASSHMVWSAIECAQRCQQDAQCVHFIMSEDGGKYLCETYTSLVRPPTATPPTDNYQKDA